MKSIRIRSKILPVKGLITLLGACLILLSFAIDFTYGNLNTYVISYLRRDNPELTYADWSWVGTSKTMVTGLTMPFMGQFSRKFGLRLSVLVGCAIYCLWLTVITLACCHGLAFSFAYAQTMEVAMRWFPHDIGFMSSFTLAGYGFGGVIWTPLETAFVNPENLSADEEDGDDVYFTDDALLDRVPKLFLLLGGIYVAMDIVGLLCMRVPSKAEEAELHSLAEDKKELEKEKEQDVAEKFSVVPLNVLKTKEFYFMWYGFFALTMVNGFVNSYAKSYGQQFIDDDQFLALVSTISSVTNGLCRIAWGKVFDVTGYQFSIVVISGLTAALLSSFICLSGIPTETGASVYYGIWVCLIYSIFPGVYACMAPGCMKTYGPEHYSSNYGLLFTVNIAYSIVNLTLVNLILDLDGGYNIMFTIIAGLCVIGMFVTILYPRHMSSEQYKHRFSNQSPHEDKEELIVEESTYL